MCVERDYKYFITFVAMYCHISPKWLRFRNGLFPDLPVLLGNASIEDVLKTVHFQKCLLLFLGVIHGNSCNNYYHHQCNASYLPVSAGKAMVHAVQKYNPVDDHSPVAPVRQEDMIEIEENDTLIVMDDVYV
jgi:hypothetical protein